MMRRAAFVLLAVVAVACRPAPPDGRTAADTILHNGRIATLDAAMSIASAVVVSGDRIVAVGDESLLERYVAPTTVDLAGRFVMPGFVDSHTHIEGSARRHIDLTTARSIAGIVEQVRARAALLGSGEWITGYGWSEDVMAERRRPLRADLDAAAPDNPVLLTRAGGHSAVANSMALRLAEIDATTPQPEGGVIEKAADGSLNGVIRERQDLVSTLVPEATDAELRDSLVAALRDQLRLGITSVTQASDTIGHFAEWQNIYRAHRGELPRANVQVHWEGEAAMAAFGRKTGDGDEFLRVGPIKIFVDGGFTGPAAYTREPYRGEAQYRGKLSIDPTELEETIRALNAAGWQAGIHAIGDAAIELAVDDLVMALDETPRVDHRHYLNHFTVMPPDETMNRMAEYGIAITQQPNFTYTLEGRYVEYLDGERLERNNPLRTPMNHGIVLAISSDILPVGPLVGIYAAVTRKGMSGRVFAADEALTMAEALQAYTLNGAFLSFEEDLKGSIEPGKLADMIVLDRDLLTIDHDHIMDVLVLQTWLGGKLVYEHAAGERR